MNHNFEIGQEFILKDLEHASPQWQNGDVIVLTVANPDKITIRCIRTGEVCDIYFPSSFMGEHMEPLLKGKAFVEDWVDRVRAS